MTHPSASDSFATLALYKFAYLLTYLFLCSDVVDHLLGLFLAVFRCLRVQMGVAAAEKLLHLFINLFTRFDMSFSRDIVNVCVIAN